MGSCTLVVTGDSNAAGPWLWLQAEACRCSVSSCLSKSQAGQQEARSVQPVLFPALGESECQAPGCSDSIDRCPWDHVQIKTEGKEAAAEHVFILLSWMLREEGGQARQSQRCGVYRGTQLIVSPGLPLSQWAPGAFLLHSFSTQNPFKTRFRSPCREAVTSGSASQLA